MKPMNYEESNKRKKTGISSYFINEINMKI